MKAGVAAAIAGVVVTLATGSITAGAGEITVYDPASRTYLTYDPDKLRRDAFGRRPPVVRQPTVRVAQPRTSTVRRGALPTLVPAPVAAATPPLPRAQAPDPEYDRQLVDYDTPEAPGTIVIDTRAKFLYYVLEGGKALRMGVGVGREGFGWTGVVTVGGKQVAPKWFPPPDMVARQPELAEYVAEGMPGGPGNPLGERAIYLYDDNGKDTLYRIHGTIEPGSIGQNVSSGCIRLLNENVIELYDLVGPGTRVVVI